MDYKRAGVDIEAGNAFVRALLPFAQATSRAGTLGTLGGFGAVFDLRAAGFSDPLVVMATDGVGTKVRIAIETGRHDTIGIDLVAMCVNDLVVQGAEPLSFLDYFATGKLDPSVALAVVRGIAQGCKQAGCALMGGETAEMPGMYPAGDYDLAGFAVGAVERHRLLPIDVQVGDMLLGLPSSGVHSNGYSLVRRIMADSQTAWDSAFDTRTFADVFLTPTTIYVKTVLELHKQNLLRAAAHITGGGLIDNLPRVIPNGLTVKIGEPWPVPAEFGWLKRTGKLSDEVMLQTFNCGIGMVLVVAEDMVATVCDMLETPIFLGKVVSGTTAAITLPDEKYWL